MVDCGKHKCLCILYIVHGVRFLEMDAQNLLRIIRRLKYVILFLFSIFLLIFRNYFPDEQFRSVIQELASAVIAASIAAFLFESDNYNKIQTAISDKLTPHTTEFKRISTELEESIMRSANEVRSGLLAVANDLSVSLRRDVLARRLYGKDVDEDVLAASSRIFNKDLIRLSHIIRCTFGTMRDNGNKIEMFISYRLTNKNISDRSVVYPFFLGVDSEAVSDPRNTIKDLEIILKSSEGVSERLKLTASDIEYTLPSASNGHYEFKLKSDAAQIIIPPGGELDANFSYSTIRKIKDKEEFAVSLCCKHFEIMLIHNSINYQNNAYKANISCVPLTDAREDMRVNLHETDTQIECDSVLFPWQGVSISWDCKPY